MVTATLLTAALWIGFQGDDPPSVNPGAVVPFSDAEIRDAFSDRALPWYDASNDKVVPLLSWPDFGTGWFKRLGDWFARWNNPFRGWFRWLNGWRIPGIGGMGDLVVKGLALLLLVLLVVGLLELLRRYRPMLNPTGSKVVVHAGSAKSIEGLPAGIRLDEGNPWDEALKRRARGDYAAAIIYLFAHQLLCLEHLKQIRLVPGKTARQLVKTVVDGNLRSGVEPTLRLFELVYYGHRVPTAEAFERVWSLAEAFERRRLEGGTS